MANPKISIIIPVYNTEEYVEEAIQSIVNQTVRDTEIIVVNDGSTDNSLLILEKLADADHRIKVYSQENQGQAVARNFGLEKAQGKYLYFMDSDDLLREDALAQCYAKCEEYQLDLVFFDAEVFGDSKWTSSFFDYDRSQSVKEDTVYSGTGVLDILITNGVFRSPLWLFLVKREFVKNIGLTFYPVRHEDLLFSALLHIRSLRVCYIAKKFFKRRLRPNSVMTTSYSSEDINAYLTIITELINAKTESTVLVTDKMVRSIINPALYNARILNLKERMSVLKICISKSYFQYLNLKDCIVFLFPFTVTLKSFFKRRNNGDY
ncbi:MAG: glycosyltransferase family 2 protein [Mangrovibacterium sp.]